VDEVALGRIVGNLLLPPGGLLVVLWLGFLLRRWRTGAWLLGTGLVLFTLLSMPAISDLLCRTVETYPPLSETDLRRGADAIVVLGGGGVPAREYGGDTVKHFTLERLRYGARLHRLTGLPVYVLGGNEDERVRSDGELMREVLAQDYGITAQAETASRNTAENASAGAALLVTRGVKRIFLVTHAFHMPRAVAQFQAQGLEVVPAPTRFHTGPRNHWQIKDFVPEAQSLYWSTLAVHEQLGQLWYAVRY
jgi:uncharacterized SAM-binding protein YcdF (DUF218 family)